MPKGVDVDAAIYGRNLFDEPVRPPSRGAVTDKFLVAPFTVLHSMDGFWQERKRAWVSMGIKSEIGRGDNPVDDEGPSDEPSKFGKCMPESIGDKYGRKQMNATSIFDPVLCEAVYRWFSAPGAQVVDPFAGGSVRGIVAAVLGRRYYGIDLRAEQVEANQVQGKELTPDNPPTWVCGDSTEALGEAPPADLLFTCPPYGDLEVYSDDPRDISTMEYHTFVAAYKRIILRACQGLKNNRFAAIVVGDFRDERGYYRGFVGDTVTAFRECGLHFYNDAVLETAIGTLPVRITRQFEAARKFGKLHQNLLVFIKGDPKAATRWAKEE